MAPSPSSFGTTSCVYPSSHVKSSRATPTDQSYFSTRQSSVIPVTPIGTAPSSARASPTPSQPPKSPEALDNSLPLSQSEMLSRLAMYLPPPPTLSRSALRPSTPAAPSPHISTSHRSSASARGDLPSPMDRSRRSPPPTHSPTMDMTTFPNKHTLHVQLPPTIQPEMITVSANKGDKLKVVADAWHMENDCHYEWQISFPPHDIDMTAVHAKFEANGHLFIDIRRLSQHTFSH